MSSAFQKVLEHHRGKVLLVNLWATWCIPCIQELPELVELQKRYAERGLKVLAVSLDDLETLEERVRPFFAERAPGLVSYISAEEDSFDFVESLDSEWLGALPSSFFIDRQGKIRKAVSGRLTFRTFEKEILKLLDEEPAGPEPQRFTEMRNGFINRSLGGQGLTQIVVRVRVIRFDPQCLRIMGDRLLDSALTGQKAT